MSPLAARPPAWRCRVVSGSCWVTALAIFFYYIIQNMLANMEARGITTGFAFLHSHPFCPPDAAPAHLDAFVAARRGRARASLLHFVSTKGARPLEAHRSF